MRALTNRPETVLNYIWHHLPSIHFELARNRLEPFWTIYRIIPTIQFELARNCLEPFWTIYEIIAFNHL